MILVIFGRDEEGDNHEGTLSRGRDNTDLQGYLCSLSHPGLYLSKCLLVIHLSECVMYYNRNVLIICSEEYFHFKKKIDKST